MKILEKQLRIGGFDLTQINREGNIAVYRQSRPNSEVEAFEVIRIRSHNGFTIAGNFCPPAELYPKSEAWGVDGFTLPNRMEAFKKAENLSQPVTR